MGFQDKVLSREINQNLYEQQKTLATAESCTGGGIAQAIIASPGASSYFKGGIVSYTNEVKTNLLHVPAELIAEKSVVSEEVAVAMVKGAIEALNTDYAVAVTGIAGPAGGTDEIPVGTIWIACGTMDNITTCKLTDDEGRDKNISNAISTALQMILDMIKK